MNFFCFLFFVFCFLINYFIPYAKAYSIEEYLGDNKIQGLKYVNDKGIDFINKYNKVYHTHWRSFPPDLRIGVVKCALPLQAKWARNIPSIERKNPNDTIYYIAIMCNKTNEQVPEKWVLYLVTTRDEKDPK